MFPLGLDIFVIAFFVLALITLFAGVKHGDAGL